MSDKVVNIILAVLSVLAILMVVLTIILMDQREHMISTPCEELRAQQGGTSYVPLPKRCDK